MTETAEVWRVRRQVLGLCSAGLAFGSLVVLLVNAALFFGIVATTGPEGVMDDSMADLGFGLASLLMYGVIFVAGIGALLFGLTGGAFQRKPGNDLANLGTALTALAFIAAIVFFVYQGVWFEQNKYY